MNNLITANIIADSIDSRNNRLTSYILNVPQIIVKELLRHRMFSFSSSSMRAIPFYKVLKDTKENMFVPIAFQSHHSGMQGTSYLTGKDAEDAKTQWIQSGLKACEEAEKLYNLGVTKQICSRIIEPYNYAKILVTATELNGFFELRCPKYSFGEKTNKAKVWKSRIDALRYFPDWKDHNDLFWLTMNKSQAEIHIQALAEAMWDARNESTPKQLKSGEFHIPFGDNINEGLWGEDGFDTKLMNDSTISQEQREEIMENIHQKIATARCARLSYMTFDNEINYQKDIELHDRLLRDHHMSPFEHVARVMTETEYDSFFKGSTYVNQNEPNFKKLNNFYKENGHGWCNNFRGFIPYRYLIENEKI